MSGTRTTRAVARDALVRVEDGAYSHVLVPQLLTRSDLSVPDRAFVTELVYGTLRSRRLLDALLEDASARPIASLDAPVRAALRLGAYQLVHGVAAHAAVSETVEVVDGRARGYVNAVLRALARTGPPWPAPRDVGTALSYPDWIVDRLTADLGAADARAALEASNLPAAVTLRANRGRTSVEELERELAASGIECVRGRLVDDALVVRRIGDVARLPAVAQGRATPQDQASQAVVRFLDPRPGQRVLDVAAAPGGKATGAAELVGPSGLVVAADAHAGRAGLVRAAARRLGLERLVTVVADGRALPLHLEDRHLEDRHLEDGRSEDRRAGRFDRVLVDAPCSGLGVLRRRAEARWRIDPDAIAGLAALQRALVLAAAPAVAPGGLLVYSVCTVTRVETLDVAADVLAELAGRFEPVDPPGEGWRPHGPGGLVLPHDAGTDGMFVMGLRRTAGG